MNLSYDSSNRKIKVMIVDDSSVIRNILTKLLEDSDDIEVVASVSNAKSAHDIFAQLLIDVVLLDIEMPIMNGIEAIPKFLEIKKDAKIIMVSTLTVKNAPIALKALSIGASDYIEKPSSVSGNSHIFKINLISKIKLLGKSTKYINSNLLSDKILESNKHNGNISLNSSKERSTEFSVPKFLNPADVVLRTDLVLDFKPHAIAIASSTGGPKAVLELIKDFDKSYLATIPVFITQHMPPFFTKLFAENIDKLGVVKCYEASDGMEVIPGCMYVAPGGHHMLPIRNSNKIVIKLEDGPQVNFCIPSADPMLKSIAELYGNKTLSIFLTGMGHDGLDGAREIVKKKGVVIAQDEKSSVVWGMPGNVAVSNLCSAVLPLNEIAKYVMIRGK